MNERSLPIRLLVRWAHPCCLLACLCSMATRERVPSPPAMLNVVNRRCSTRDP